MFITLQALELCECHQAMTLPIPTDNEAVDVNCPVKLQYACVNDTLSHGTPGASPRRLRQFITHLSNDVLDTGFNAHLFRARGCSIKIESVLCQFSEILAEC